LSRSSNLTQLNSVNTLATARSPRYSTLYCSASSNFPPFVSTTKRPNTLIRLILTLGAHPHSEPLVLVRHRLGIKIIFDMQTPRPSLFMGSSSYWVVCVTLAFKIQSIIKHLTRCQVLSSPVVLSAYFFHIFRKPMSPITVLNLYPKLPRPDRVCREYGESFKDNGCRVLDLNVEDFAESRLSNQHSRSVALCHML
jgi:hypothetical protein